MYSMYNVEVCATSMMMVVVLVLVVLVMTVSIVVVVTLFIVTVMGSVGRGSLSNTVHRYT